MDQAMQGVNSRPPTFFIIGAMKSATSSLHEQLAGQPGIFMSEPKEPNFFSDDEVYARGVDWYEALFAARETGAISGESSTHYTKLPTHPDTLARLRDYAADPLFIYVMRHPVDRLVSHYIHEWSMGNFRGDIAAEVRKHPELVAYGQYARQLSPYFEAFGQQAVLPVFFDRLLDKPQEELTRICRFIGYRGQPVWSDSFAAKNVSAERIRRFPLYGLLVESRLAAWLRQTLIPQEWRDAVKNRLQMRKRPELSEDLRLELEQEFDTDLARLGKMLGMPLSCRNFKELTRSSEPEWVSTSG